MQSITVDITPDVLDWALQQSGDELLDEDFTSRVKQWIDGIKKPTFNQIEDLSRKTRIPLGYFFLKNPPKEAIKLIDFRTINSLKLIKPSRDLIDTVSDMEGIRDWLHDYRIDSGYDVCGAVGLAKGCRNPQEIVKSIREYMYLDENWYTETKSIDDSFSYIREKMNQIGITVMINGVVRNNTRRALDVDEFRAFAIVDDIAPLVFINSADSHSARLFSLLHELVHIILGENDLFNDRQHTVENVSSTEIICNAVAGELLVPINAFVKEWNLNNDDDLYDKMLNIAKRFHCGVLVIARKALDNGKITSKEYNLMAKIAIEKYREKKKSTDSTGGNYYNTMESRMDRALVRAICTGLSERRITYSEAFRLTNTNMKTFPDLAYRLGGVVNW